MDISDLFQWIGQVGRSWMQTSYGMHHSRHSRSMSWAQSKGQVETARSPTSEYTKVALQPSLSILGGWYDVGCWLLAIIYELLCPHYITNISQWYPHHIKPRLRFRPCRHFLNQRWPSLVLPFGNPTWQLKTPCKWRCSWENHLSVLDFPLPQKMASTILHKLLFYFSCFTLIICLFFVYDEIWLTCWGQELSIPPERGWFPPRCSLNLWM